MTELEQDYFVRCPACGTDDDLEPHFVDHKRIDFFTCTCGQKFTGDERTGARAKPKGKAAMATTEKRREQQLLENAVPVGDVVSRVLVCELTLDELRERGVELANAMTAERELAEEKANVISDFKSREKQLTLKTSQLHKVVETRREYREVDCHEYHDYKAGKVYIVRDDLGTIPETRAMTATERQRQLPNTIAERAMDKTAEQLGLEKVGEKKPDATTTSDGDNSSTDKKKTRQAGRAATATQ